MTISHDARRRYLEEGASACPACLTPGRIRRMIQSARLERPIDAAPVLVVGCYCGECGTGWAESYRLESLTSESAEVDR